MKNYSIKYTDEDGKYFGWIEDVKASSDEQAIKQAKFELRDVVGLKIVKYEINN